MKTYKEVRQEMAGGQVVEGNAMPCSICRDITPHETLRNFGARCGRCFTAYCRSAFDGTEAPVSRDVAAAKLREFGRIFGDH